MVKQCGAKAQPMRYEFIQADRCFSTSPVAVPLFWLPLCCCNFLFIILFQDAWALNSNVREREETSVEELLGRFSRQWYTVLCVGVVLVWFAAAHCVGVADENPQGNHERTSRRLRALHGPPLHLRPHPYF